MKGVKSQMSGSSAATMAHNNILAGASSDLTDVAKLKAENGRLKNQIKCLEIEVEQKEEKVKKLLLNCVGAPDEALEEKELRIAELEDKVEQLE